MVYVDNMKAQYGRMTMCHMIADNTDELLDMARKIGANIKWIQNPGMYSEHFDICLSKRALAIKHGAVEITLREIARKMADRRKLALETLQKSEGNNE